MVPTQKVSWFNLAVIAVSLVTVVGLIPVLGIARAQGGFGFLGLLGFGAWFYRKRPGMVVTDERDVAIRQVSGTIAYGVFWVMFVLAGTTVSLIYGSTGGVPVYMVQMSIWVGLILVVGVSSIANLAQYAIGGTDAAE